MKQVLQFGRLSIAPDERSARLDGAPLALGARAFDVLAVLTEHPERFVTKAELLDRVWPGRVVEENNLTVQVSALRRALGFDAIATVPGRGYRLTWPRSDGLVAAAEAVPEASSRLERRLAVVAHADVVGWQRLVARDAEAAVRGWQRLREQLIERSLAQYAGRVIELVPERVQLEFGSAIDAVAWSLQLQQELAAQRQPALPLRMRIGLCVDDVIVDAGKLVGDGVNVAAEVHGCAEHDEVLVTGFVRELVERRLPVRFLPLGERMMRQLQRPLALYRAEPATLPQGAHGLADPAAAERSEAERSASVAVLPMTAENPATDPSFASGMTDEIIATLAQNRSLFVIAHSSTLRYRDRHLNLAQVAAELGVRYLVTGSVRRSGRQLRIGVSLVRAEDARVIWQERYDGADAELFAFQAEIAANVAAAIDPCIRDAEVARVRQARPGSQLGAYEWLLRATDAMYRFDDPAFDAVGGWLEQALQAAPDYAQAHAHLAWWLSLRVGQGRAVMGDGVERRALDHALTGMRLDPRDAWCLTVAGHLSAWLEGRLDDGLALLERALALNPSCAAAWTRSGVVTAYLGRGDEALERVRRALRLSPFDQEAFTYHTASGLACLVAGRADEAVGWLGKSLRLNPRYNASRRLQIAALVMAGELAEARSLARELMDAAPHFTVQAFGRWYPLCEPHRGRLLQAMRQAGLPDQ